jgi:hypothetical protein
MHPSLHIIIPSNHHRHGLVHITTTVFFVDLKPAMIMFTLHEYNDIILRVSAGDSVKWLTTEQGRYACSVLVETIDFFP